MANNNLNSNRNLVVANANKIRASYTPETFADLLTRAADVLDPKVQKLNLKTLNELETAARDLLKNRSLADETNLSDFIARIDQLRNAIIDRNTFLTALNTLHTTLTAIREREERNEIIRDISAMISTWNLSQLRAVNALCETFKLN